MVTTGRSRGEGGGRGLDRLALAFDDERAVANAGLVLAGTLVDRLGIEQVVDETLDLGERPGAARPGRKLLTLRRTRRKGTRSECFLHGGVGRNRLPTIVVERDLLVELWPSRAGSWVIPRRRIADGAACAADGAGTDSVTERERDDGPKP